MQPDGIQGRLAVYEVMDFTQDLKELVLKGENSLALRKAAIANGMETLSMSALSHAIAGLTSLAEATSCIFLTDTSCPSMGITLKVAA